MAETIQYKCPCCGGRLEFDSGLQKMKCPYCDTTFDVETLEGYDDALKQDAKDDMHWDAAQQPWDDVQMGVYTCKSCGGELVCDESTAATACPFCGNPIVLTGRLSGDLKPDYVIPFKLDKKAAEAALRNHMKGKRLLPNLFRSENRISEVKGVYVPFWLFDADADAHIRYHATRIRTWSDRDYDYTETQHYAILRSGDLSFTHVPVDGSSRMPNDLMESIEPFDFSSAVDFQTAYLSGYLADRYDVNADDSIGRANERVKKSTESVFASTVVGYHTVVPESTSVRLANGRVRYALYPVWLLNTVWNGKTFSFAMNGQTGKFVGDLPVDKGKKWRWFGLVSGIAAAAASLWPCVPVAAAALREGTDMKRTLTLLTLLLALLALLVLPAAAADLPRLVDNADLLMADDAEALLADLDSRSEALQFDIVIVTVDSLDGETPRNYAEDFFWYNNYGLGEDRDGALLLVAMDTRDWYIATHGFGITAITPAGREAMADRFLPQLSNAEYAAAFSTFAEECEDYVNQARNGSAYDTGNLPDEPFEAPGFLWVVACLLFGALIGGITVGVMAAKHKTVRRQPAANSYVVQDSLHLTQQSDLFLYANTTRTARPKDNDRSGSDAHSGSGGSSFGGGGGKF